MQETKKAVEIIQTILQQENKKQILDLSKGKKSEIEPR